MVDMQLREQKTLYDSLRDKFNSIETENQQLKEQIEEHIQRTAALEIKCRQAMDENAATVQQNQEKCQEIAVLTEESESNVAKLQSLRLEFDALTLKVDENYRTIGNLNDAKASLQQQLNVCADEVAELNIQLETANVNLIAAETIRSELVSEHQKILSQKDAKLSEAESEKCSLYDQINDLKSSFSSAQEINAKLRTENEELVLAVEKAETMLSELASQHQEILSQKDAKLSEAEKEINDLKTSVSSADESNVKLRTENEELAQVVEEVERIRSELASQLEEIRSQKDAISVQTDADMSSLRDQVEKLKSSSSSAEETRVALQTRNEELVMAMEKEKDELRKTINESTSYRKDRDSLQKSSADLAERIANLTAERQQIDTSNEQVLSEANSLRNKLDIVEKSRLELESRLKVLACSRDNLEIQLNQSDDEKEKLFLNLQEKIDEAEASELALKEWSKRYENEVAKYESAVQRNNLVCESYELQVASLTNATTELTECKQNLTQSNEDLRAELSRIRTQLDAMHKQRCTVLESENESLKKSVEEIESKRNALISQLEVAEREVVESRDRLHQKDREVIELSKALDVLKSESAANIAARTKIEAELQLNVDRVDQLTKQLDESKMFLSEKVELVHKLQLQMETLKASDITMMTKNSELSESYEALAKELESVESSRDSLSLQCTSLTEELKTVQDKCNKLETDRSTEASARCAEVKSLEMQVDSLKKEIAVVLEVADRKQSELLAKLQANEEETATVSSRADANIAELLESLEKLTTRNESLQISILSSAEQLREKISEADQLRRENEQLLKSIEELTVAATQTLRTRVNNEEDEVDEEEDEEEVEEEGEEEVEEEGEEEVEEEGEEEVEEEGEEEDEEVNLELVDFF